MALLSGLGLTEAEARVYIKLLREGSATAGELAKLTWYSRTKVYEILEKLQREGLVESYPSRPAQFKALDPSISIPVFIQPRRRELETAEKTLCRSLSKIWSKTPSQGAMVFINEGFGKSTAKFLELINNAEEKIYTFMAWVAEEEYNFLLNAFKKAHERGVEIRMAVYDNPDFRDRVSYEMLAEFSDCSHEFYLVPRDFYPFPLPPVKLLVVDEREVNIVIGDFFETGSLSDATSVHYHGIQAVSMVAKKIVPLYFEGFFAKFRRQRGENYRNP